MEEGSYTKTNHSNPAAAAPPSFLPFSVNWMLWGSVSCSGVLGHLLLRGARHVRQSVLPFSTGSLAGRFQPRPPGCALGLSTCTIYCVVCTFLWFCVCRVVSMWSALAQAPNSFLCLITLSPPAFILFLHYSEVILAQYIAIT